MKSQSKLPFQIRLALAKSRARAKKKHLTKFYINLDKNEFIYEG